MTVTATANFSDFKDLAGRVQAAERSVVASATERAAALVQGEAPGGPSGRIGKGVRPVLELNVRPARGEVSAEAPSKRAAGAGVLHMAGGGTRSVELRGAAEVNVAELVAEGTGLYGRRGKLIRPQRARVLLIGVESVPAGESYIAGAGGKFIMRRTSEGMRPDDYPGRAADRLEGELEGLADSALSREGF